MTGRAPFACLALLAALVVVAIAIPATASASNTCDAETCASMTIYKYGPTVVNPGDTADFTFVVYNTGYENITGLTVTDDHCSPLSDPTGDTGDDGVLTPFYYTGDYETWTYTCSYKIDGEPGTTVENVAHAAGVANGNPVTAETSHTTWISGLVVTKTVDRASADPYDVLTYTISVKNVDPENGPSYQIPYNGVSDDGCVDLQQTSEGPGDQQSWFLDPGDVLTFTCHYDNFNPGPTDGGKYVNTACVHAWLDYGEVAASEGQGDQTPPLQSCGSAATSLAQHFVTGRVFQDANRDGQEQSDEAAMTGVTVYADLNNNGQPDQGEPSTTTDAAGNYTLPVSLGTTVIREVTPANHTCSFPSGCSWTVELAKNAPPSPPVLSRAAGRATDPSGKDFGNAPPAVPAVTEPAPAQLVLPERIIPGVARLTGKTGCIAGKGFYARIRGSKMVRVIFFIDGQAMKSVVQPKDDTTYRYRVDVSKLRVGRHTLRVEVTYTTKSRTKSRSLRLSFQRCAAQLRAPAFTG